VIVAGVEAGIVESTVDADPVCAIDAPAVDRGRTGWKGTGHFDPAVLPLGDHPDFIGHLREILVLAQRNRFWPSMKTMAFFFTGSAGIFGFPF
jgi:hypothetical protein